MNKIIWRRCAVAMTGKAISLLLAITLAGCAGSGVGISTTALESQNKALNADRGRIYLLRPYSWTYQFVTAAIKINGVKVGDLAKDSYLFVDRPPGRYTINVAVGRGAKGINHDVQIMAGRKYYYAINMRSQEIALQGGAFFTLHEARAGKPIPNRDMFAGLYLGELDPDEGAAMIAKLKAQ